MSMSVSVAGQTVMERIRKVEKQLEDMSLDCLIVLSSDAHQSEYLCERDRCLKYVSGFTGSAGTVLLSRTALASGKQASLITDGRYTVQASKELDQSKWSVFQTGAR